jgi:hypothetical protein
VPPAAGVVGREDGARLLGPGPRQHQQAPGHGGGQQRAAGAERDAAGAQQRVGAVPAGVGGGGGLGGRLRRRRRGALPQAAGVVVRPKPGGCALQGFRGRGRGRCRAADLLLLTTAPVSGSSCSRTMQPVASLGGSP